MFMLRSIDCSGVERLERLGFHCIVGPIFVSFPEPQGVLSTPVVRSVPAHNGTDCATLWRSQQDRDTHGRGSTLLATRGLHSWRPKAIPVSDTSGGGCAGWCS